MPALVFKVRGGKPSYIDRNGKVRTAGKGILASEEVAFTVAATQDQTLFQWTEGGNGGDAEEARPIQDMQAVREADAPEEDVERQVGVDARLQETAILRSKVHGGILRGANGDGYAIMDDSSLPREKDMSSGTVRGLRQGGEDGRSPQERQLAGQLARELDSGMSELPPKAARRNEEEQKASTAETGQGKYVIRRLMPVEAERLQGFPDGWTDVPYKGKEHPSDTPRYKAIGNSMAVPVMRWIGERIQMVDKMEVGA